MIAMVMYNACLTKGAHLEIPGSSISFGKRDFSAGAMITTTVGGPVVSYGTSETGFLVEVTPDAIISFRIKSTAGFRQVATHMTGVLDGCCHSLLAVRKGSWISILLDGEALESSNIGEPVDVDSADAKLLIGGTRMRGALVTQFEGSVMNVGVWDTALATDRAVAAAFGRVTADDPNLQGYWTLDQTLEDRSPNGNAASMVGAVRFLPCVDCIFTGGKNGYGFCQMANVLTPAQRTDPDLLAADPISQARHVSVRPGTPALFASIMSTADQPAFPAGAAVTLSDPSGRIYNTDVNTDTAFVATHGGQPWGVAIINPTPGPWRLAVSAPPISDFVLQLQTCPSTAVVPTITDALRPLYGPSTQPSGATEAEGWTYVLARVAVTALVGVVMVAAPELIPYALIAASAAFTVIDREEAAAMLPALATGSISAASQQIAGSAGFLVAVDGLLLVDAAVPPDRDKNGTFPLYENRKQALYPYVTASTFNKKRKDLVGARDTRQNVRKELLAFKSGYVTISGHGLPDLITGWPPVTAPDVPEPILKRGQYDPSEIESKIIHIFGCSCGAKGGLGQDMVSHGAVAFFGYSDRYELSKMYAQDFCDCDIAIDKALIDGKTCDEAYEAAIAKFNATIAYLIRMGRNDRADNLKRNRDLLVAPSTDAAYGDKTARLNIGAPPLPINP
jgi:hypothetical protein